MRISAAVRYALNERIVCGYSCSSRSLDKYTASFARPIQSLLFLYDFNVQNDQPTRYARANESQLQ